MMMILMSLFITLSFAQERVGIVPTGAIDAKQDDSETDLKVEEEEEKEQLNLTTYYPIYFIYDNDNSKVQASFKYKLIKDANIYLGYTHLILWDLSAESKPFIDVNYNPELFYRWKDPKINYVDFIDFIPWGHTSNGQDGLETRSLDYVGVQINFKTKLKKTQVLRTALRIRYMSNFDEENEDIREYQGPVELRFSLTEFTRGFFDKGELLGRIYSGGEFGQDFSKGGQEIGLAFRIQGLEITPSFYLQYFHGYAESLKDYNQKQDIVRFGLIL